MISYKNRRVDRNKPVDIYRNLSNRGGRWSIRQKGLVVAHANNVSLRNVVFIASKSGMRRSLKIGHKIVCAHARGMLCNRKYSGNNQVVFEMGIGFNVEKSAFAIFNEKGCFVE